MRVFIIYLYEFKHNHFVVDIDTKNQWIENVEEIEIFKTWQIHGLVEDLGLEVDLHELDLVFLPFAREQELVLAVQRQVGVYSTQVESWG